MLWAPRPCTDSGLGFVLCLVTHPSRLLPGPISALMLRLFRWALKLCLALVTAPPYGHLRNSSPCTTPGELCLSLVLQCTRRKVLCWTHWVEFAWMIAELAMLLGHWSAGVPDGGWALHLTSHLQAIFQPCWWASHLSVLLPTGLVALCYFTDNGMDGIWCLASSFWIWASFQAWNSLLERGRTLRHPSGCTWCMHVS